MPIAHKHQVLMALETVPAIKSAKAQGYGCASKVRYSPFAALPAKGTCGRPVAEHMLRVPVHRLEITGRFQ